MVYMLAAQSAPVKDKMKETTMAFVSANATADSLDA
jgi:hypothetical protein